MHPYRQVSRYEVVGIFNRQIRLQFSLRIWSGPDGCDHAANFGVPTDAAVPSRTDLLLLHKPHSSALWREHDPPTNLLALLASITICCGNDEHGPALKDRTRSRVKGTRRAGWMRGFMALGCRVKERRRGLEV